MSDSADPRLRATGGGLLGIAAQPELQSQLN